MNFRQTLETGQVQVQACDDNNNEPGEWVCADDDESNGACDLMDR